MPRTIQQFERLTTIHNKLATGNRYTFDELRTACMSPEGRMPSERTMYDDLRRLREEYGAPIPERDRSAKPYYYRPGERFSLHGAFNPDDAALANEAAALLKQVSHLPQFAGLEDVFLKLEQRAGVVGRAEKSVLQYEQNLDYVGLKWLQPLYDAMQQDRQVWVTYRPFGQTPVQLSFSAYLLKEFNNRWHVYGCGAETHHLNSLALDRIESLKIRPDLLRQANPTDWEQYLTDVIGFTRFANTPVELFIVRVHFPRANYVETKPLHPSQVVLTRTEKYLDFQYSLHWNRELEAKIFEFGPDAELLSPPQRRDEIRQKVIAMRELYG